MPSSIDKSSSSQPPDPRQIQPCIFGSASLHNRRILYWAAAPPEKFSAYRFRRL